MIKQLSIKGLNGSRNLMEFKFNDDLNLLTGINGCGKTTILKLLWFVNSGKIDYLSEIDFEKLSIVSDKYRITIVNNKDVYMVTFVGFSEDKDRVNDDVTQFDIPIITEAGVMGRRKKQIEFNTIFDVYSDASIFFPTFRRIEGGFSMERYGTTRFRDGILIRESFRLKDALFELSEDLSSNDKKHQFVSSVSTDDISSLVNDEYSRIVRETNELQTKKFDEIRKRLKNRESKTPDEILNLIDREINAVAESSKEKLKPFNVLEKLIKKIFHEKGIKMKTIDFGNKNLISSDKLSAGEKQMLSFLCYNTFSKNKLIFIDEPELSLHPDWQRLLVPTLLQQGNHNQFFVATHSPFIYSKYSDKEIQMDEDKGNENLDVRDL